MNLKDAMAGGGALLTGLALVIGAVVERTAAPAENAYDLVAPSQGPTDVLLQVCQNPATEFERTASPHEGDPDLLLARLVEVNRTTYLTWAEGGPNAVIEVAKAGPDSSDTDPASAVFADCMKARAPIEAKEPFK